MDNKLDNLTQYITDTANADAKGIVDAARADFEEGKAAAIDKFALLFAKQKDELTEQSKTRINEAKAELSADANRELTGYVYGLIDGIFDEVNSKLCGMDSTQFLQFYNGIIAKLNLNGEYKVVLGEKTAALLDGKTRGGLEIKTEKFSLVVDGKTVKNEGGFVLEKAPVEYSFLFSEMLEALKQKEAPTLFKQFSS